MKPTFFSGIQPTAQAPHLGNYLGVFKQWVDLQKDYAPFYCIVDLHAITIPQETERFKQALHASYAMLLAVGIDPNLSTLFVQSHNRYHTELAWILNCFTSYGELLRMTQFKEKSAKQKEIISVGLYDYPVLMAADILLYDSQIVPVGEDQVQHVELTRDIASRFNHKYGNIFRLPKAKLLQGVARIMSLQDPTKKMSKSDENPNACLFLLDEPDTIHRKIRSSVTDSQTTIAYDPKRPGLANLLSIYRALTGQEMVAIEAKYRGKGYQEFKEELAEIVINFLGPIQQRYNTFINDKTELERLMKENAAKAIAVAEHKVREVKRKIGFIL